MRLATFTLALMLSVTAQAGPGIGPAGPAGPAGHADSVSADPAAEGPGSAAARVSPVAHPASPAADLPTATALLPMGLQQGNGTDENGTADDDGAGDDGVDDELDEGSAVTSRSTAIGLGALALVVLVFFFVRTARK